MSSPKPQICIRITPKNKQSFIEINTPRKIEIKSGFGSQIRQCWIKFYSENNALSVNIGDQLNIEINESAVFQGFIVEKRIDSIDDQLSIVAQLTPTRLWNRAVNGMFESFRITDLLSDLISGTGLSLQLQESHPISFSEIAFSEDSLFQTIDLLAKIAGNWYWNISDEGVLSFKSPTSKPNHCIHLKHDHYTVNIRENHSHIYSVVEIECGVRDLTTYQKEINIPDVSQTSQGEHTRIFARPVTTPDVFLALERSIRQQMSVPHFEHYVDLLGEGETIQPGDTVRFGVNDAPLFPQEQTFRVKQRDITYAHEELQTRLHLTTGFESAPSYFYYFRSDRPQPKLFLKGKTGVFQLDVSALDSQSKLDAA